MKLDQIAINSVSTQHADIEEALHAYAAAGFKKVEWVIPQVKEWLNSPVTPKRTTGDVRALLASHGIASVGGFETTMLSFGDLAKKKENHALLIANAELLSELGGGTMVVGTDGDEKNNLDTLKAIGRTMRELVNRMPESVKLAVEFNWSPVVKSLRSAVVVVEEAAHERVGILFDPAHYHCTPTKFDDLTETVVKKIVHVHVDDMRDVPGDRCNCNDDRVLPGDGIVGVKKLFDRLESLGYRGLFSIEMFSADLWALSAGEAARKMYAAMEKLCK